MLSLINLELAHNNFAQVVSLYEKALRGLGGAVGAAPGVEIWRTSQSNSVFGILTRILQDRIFTTSAGKIQFLQQVHQMQRTQMVSGKQ